MHCYSTQSLSLIVLICHCHSLDLSFLHSYFHLYLPSIIKSTFVLSSHHGALVASFIHSLHSLAIMSFYNSSLQYSSHPYPLPLLSTSDQITFIHGSLTGSLTGRRQHICGQKPFQGGTEQCGTEYHQSNHSCKTYVII